MKVYHTRDEIYNQLMKGLKKHPESLKKGMIEFDFEEKDKVSTLIKSLDNTRQNRTIYFKINYNHPQNEIVDDFLTELLDLKNYLLKTDNEFSKRIFYLLLDGLGTFESEVLDFAFPYFGINHQVYKTSYELTFCDDRIPTLTLLAEAVAKYIEYGYTLLEKFDLQKETEKIKIAKKELIDLIENRKNKVKIKIFYPDTDRWFGDIFFKGRYRHTDIYLKKFEDEKILFSFITVKYYKEFFHDEDNAEKTKKAIFYKIKNKDDIKNGFERKLYRLGGMHDLIYSYSSRFNELFNLLLFYQKSTKKMIKKIIKKF